MVSSFRSTFTLILFTLTIYVPCLMYCIHTVKAQDCVSIRQFDTRHGLGSNIIMGMAIYEDYLWVATQGGLYTFDGQTFQDKTYLAEKYNKRFFAIDTNNGRLEAFSTTHKITISGETVDANPIKNLGKLIQLRNTNGGIMFHQVKVADSIASLLAPIADNLERPSPYISIFRGIRLKNRIGFVAKDGYYVFDGGTVAKHVSIKDVLPQSITTVDNFVFYLTNTEKVLWCHQYGTPQAQPFFKSKSSIRIIQSNDNTLYFSSGDSVFRISRSSKSELLCKYLFQNRDISNLSTFALEVDNINTVFSTGTNGLYFVSPCDVHTAFKGDTGVHYSLSISNDAYSVFSSTARRTYSPTKQEPVKHDYIAEQSVVTRRNKEIWYAEHEGNNSKIFMQLDYNHDRKYITSLKGSISHFYEDLSGRLWMFANIDFAYYFKGHLTKFNRINPDNEHTVTNCRQIGKDSFLYSTPIGLNLFLPHEKRVIKYNRLSGIEVRDIEYINDSLIMLSTYGHGLFVFDKQHFYQLPADKKGKLMLTHDIIRVGDSLVLFVTNAGVLFTSTENLYSWKTGLHKTIFYYYLSEENTDWGIEYNGGVYPLCVIDKNNWLYMPTMRGIRKVNLRQLNTQYTNSTIRFELSFDDTSCVNCDSIALKSSNSELELRISNDWNSRDNREYWYSITNKKTNDPIWYPLNERSITLSGLWPGSNEIQIKKRVGIENDDFVSKAIIVYQPPSWRDKYILPVSLIALTLLLLIILQYVSKVKLARQNRSLTIGIQKKSLELMVSNKVNSKIVYFLTHEILGICASSEQAINLYKEKPTDRLLNEFSNTITLYKSKISSMLSWLTVERKDFSLNLVYFNLSEFLLEVISLYEYTISSEAVIETSLATPGIIVNSDKGILRVIMENIIDNTVKYAKKQSLNVKTYRDGHFAVVEFRDIGPGFDARTLNWIDMRMRKPNEYRPIDNNHLNMGIGIDISIDLVNKIGGQIVFDNYSVSGLGGAIVTIKIPAPETLE